MKLKEGGWCERKGTLRDDGHYKEREGLRGKHHEETAKNVKVCKGASIHDFRNQEGEGVLEKQTK